MTETYQFAIVLPEDRNESHSRFHEKFPSNMCAYEKLENTGIFLCREDENDYPARVLDEKEYSSPEEVERILIDLARNTLAEGIIVKSAMDNSAEVLFYHDVQKRTAINSRLEKSRGHSASHAFQATLTEYVDGSVERFYRRFKEDFNPRYKEALQEVLQEKGILKPRKRNPQSIPTV